MPQASKIDGLAMIELIDFSNSTIAGTTELTLTEKTRRLRQRENKDKRNEIGRDKSKSIK